MAAPVKLTTVANVNLATGGIYQDNGSFTTDGSGNLTTGKITASASLVAGGAVNIKGGLTYDQISGPLPATSVTQSVPIAAGSAITMTGSGRIIRVSCSALTTTTALTPTASSLTGSNGFVDGVEVTLYNVAVTGSNISISAGAGAPFVLIGQNMATFIYDAANQIWIHRN